MHSIGEGGFKVIAVCLAVVLTVSSVSAEQDDSYEHFGFDRIVNGIIITIDKAPYIVQLRNETDGVICGGTLITTQHVVTAAHCFNDYESHQYKLLSIMAGVSTRNETGQRRLLGKVFLHPRRIRATNDIAVIKLDKPVVTSENVKIMENLCSKPLKAKDTIQISGWGQIYEDGPYSTELRTVSIPVLPNEDCSKKAIKEWFSPESMICAYTDGKDTCHTDSGGPGIFEEELCAVVSWGIGCATKGSPGVYVNVYALRDFIEEKIKL